MIRTQVRLTEYQSKRLNALATRQGVSVAELIRRAIDCASDTDLMRDEQQIRARALEVVGKYADNAHDVSEQHDKYLTES